jgi:GGDEF domain-containing protein
VAHTLVDKLRQALTHPREGDELPFPLSASFGIAGCTADDPDLQGLIERADAEMYADKRQRRASTGARA